MRRSGGSGRPVGNYPFPDNPDSGVNFNGFAVYTRTNSFGYNGTGITGRDMYMEVTSADIFTDPVPVNLSNNVLYLWVSNNVAAETNINPPLTVSPVTSISNKVASPSSTSTLYVGHMKIKSSTSGYNLYSLETSDLHNIFKIPTTTDNIGFLVTNAIEDGFIGGGVPNTSNLFGILRLKIVDFNNGHGEGGAIC